MLARQANNRLERAELLEEKMSTIAFTFVAFSHVTMAVTHEHGQMERNHRDQTESSAAGGFQPATIHHPCSLSFPSLYSTLEETMSSLALPSLP